jgi:hypothetical protein
MEILSINGFTSGCRNKVFEKKMSVSKIRRMRKWKTFFSEKNGDFGNLARGKFSPFTCLLFKLWIVTFQNFIFVSLLRNFISSSSGRHKEQIMILKQREIKKLPGVSH